MSDSELIGAADKLYALLPQEFTAERTKLEKTARADGHKQLAAEIRSFTKPSASAWVINMLARHKPDELEQLGTLGESLRHAQDDLDRDAIRELTVTRRRMVSALAKQASALAVELGHHVSPAAIDEVEETLHAALADADAAVAVASGRLLRPLSSNGIDRTDLIGAIAGPGAAPRAKSASAHRATKRKGPSKAELEAARRELEEAAALADEESDHLEALERRLAAIDRDRTRAQQKVTQLEKQATQLREAIAESDEQYDELDTERSDAVRSVEQSRRQADRAKKRLDRL